jgi:putative transposase
VPDEEASPMKKSRFNESQIVVVLKEVEAGVPIANRLRKHGISRPTYFLWKSKYGAVRCSALLGALVIARG